MATKKGDYVVVRSKDAGVFAGTFVSREDDVVVLRDARRIWYWEGAASLSQLAMEGTSKPDECKFPREVDEVTLLGVIEILATTEEARKSIAGVRVWKA